MPSIQLDKILENISIEKALYKNEEKSKSEEEDAWKRVAKNNNITTHEAKAIYNVLIRKFNTEKAKGNSTWKMYDIMQNIQEGEYDGQEPEKEKEENEGMVELMEVFEEEDSASDNNSELDKSNGSCGSKTSGISTRSSTGSQKGSPEATQKKLLNTTNMIPIPTIPSTPKSQVFVPPNLQKVNLKPMGNVKKDTTVKRKADLSPPNAGGIKRPAILGSRPKPQSSQTRSPVQAQIPQVSGSSEAAEKYESQTADVSNIKVESTTQIKAEPIANGYLETSEHQNNEDLELKLPPNFFKHLCSSNRHEAFGLYIANFMNRLDKSSAKKLELRLLQTITDFQSEHDN